MRAHETFVEVVEALIVAGDVVETVEGIVAYTCEAMGTSHVGITLRHAHGKRLESIGPTSSAVLDADEAQHILHEGPCVDAATAVGTVWSGDLGRDRRWPRWGPRAARLGFRSIVSTQLSAGGRTVGVLNVYGERHDQFGAEDATLARELAQHAVVALVAARRLADLETALETRTLIGQAQGVLMARHGVDADAAFSVLRRYSQEQNLKLRLVAEQVVGMLHDPLDPAR